MTLITRLYRHADNARVGHLNEATADDIRAAADLIARLQDERDDLQAQLWAYQERPDCVKCYRLETELEAANEDAAQLAGDLADELGTFKAAHNAALARHRARIGDES